MRSASFTLALASLALTSCASAPPQSEGAWYGAIEQGELWWASFAGLGRADARAVLDEALAEEAEFLAEVPEDYVAAPFQCCYDRLDEHQLGGRDVAFASLLNRRSVTESHDPDEGLPSYDYIAVSTLAAQSDAREVFVALAERAYVAGQLYALVGLRDVDAARFGALADRLAASDEEVYSFATGAYLPVADLARAIRAGAQWPVLP